MGYYRGDYYRGDYYQGGIFSSLGRLAKPLAGIIPGGGIVTTALGAASLFPKRKGAQPKMSGAVRPSPGLGGVISRLLPGGDTGYYKRRRMNVANVKALRRAIRRAHGFAKLSRKVLTFPISKPPRGRPLFKKSARRR